jgi:hypothetical protein
MPKQGYQPRLYLNSRSVKASIIRLSRPWGCQVARQLPRIAPECSQNRKALACQGLSDSAMEERSERPRREAYLRLLEIEVNLVLSVEPRPFTVAMIASAIPAAIRPYSIAVAPDSSFTKRAITFFIRVTPECTRAAD